MMESGPKYFLWKRGRVRCQQYPYPELEELCSGHMVVVTAPKLTDLDREELHTTFYVLCACYIFTLALCVCYIFTLVLYVYHTYTLVLCAVYSCSMSLLESLWNLKLSHVRLKGTKYLSLI